MTREFANLLINCSNAYALWVPGCHHHLPRPAVLPLERVPSVIVPLSSDIGNLLYVFGVTLVAGAAFSISLELSMQGYPMQEMFWM
jgi:hypothetical protein